MKNVLENIVILAIIFATILGIMAICGGCEDTADANVMVCEPNAFSYIPLAVSTKTTAIKASHYETDVKWVVPDFEDLRNCSDDELADIAIFCAIGQCATDVNDFIWLGEKLMPKRFKVDDATEIDPNTFLDFTIDSNDWDHLVFDKEQEAKW